MAHSQLCFQSSCDDKGMDTRGKSAGELLIRQNITHLVTQGVVLSTFPLLPFTYNQPKHFAYLTSKYFSSPISSFLPHHPWLRLLSFLCGVIQSTFFNFNGIKPRNRRKSRKLTNIWKLNNIHVNNRQVKEAITKGNENSMRKMEIKPQHIKKHETQPKQC